jgi:hypothetical protein
LKNSVSLANAGLMCCALDREELGGPASLLYRRLTVGQPERFGIGDHEQGPRTVLSSLVSDLSITDQQFRHWWAAHRVAHQEFGIRP